MSLSSWQIHKIETLVSYKETLADLYASYSEIFPDYQYFFLTMAVQNVRQADWLRSCIDNIKKGTYQYDRLRFKIEAVKTGLNYIKTQLESTKEKTPTLKGAVSIALAIETSLISNKFFEIIEPTTSDLEIIFNYFRSEQQDNVNKLRRITSYRKSKLSYKFYDLNSKSIPRERDRKGVA